MTLFTLKNILDGWRTMVRLWKKACECNMDKVDGCKTEFCLSNVVTKNIAISCPLGLYKRFPLFTEKCHNCEL